MAFPLPDKPSIAVLPFVNMSDDPRQMLRVMDEMEGMRREDLSSKGKK